MIKKVYIDTSVVGGYFDEEFEFWTKIFFESVKKHEFQIVISELLTEELKSAPEFIRDFLNKFPSVHKLFVELTEEVETLAQKYINSQIVGIKSLADCRHIATATVNEIEILTSWNFKHIVNLNKIHLYNGVNLQSGYRTVEIRTPREIVNYED
ncbi:MAG: PIN domain protein [Bacteroidota bacterium]